MRLSVEGTTARVCVGLLVVALHLVALILALTTVWNRRETASDSRTLSLINIEATERKLLEERPPAPEPTMRAPRSVGSTRANIPVPNESSAVTDPATIPDWRGSMQAAASAAVGRAIRDGSYQSLGPVEREQRAGSASEPSIFETPKRKAGDIDHDATQGRTLIWHDENCFTELRFPTIKDPNALIGAPNPPKCMLPIGEREARGDLFKSIEKQ